MKQKNLLFRIFLVIFLVAVAGIIGLLVRDHIQKDKDQKLREKAAVSVQEEPEVSAEAEETPVQIPVDFSVLQAENPDIYAWIHIADTPVDYPILQSKVDDDYYMDHTVDDKEGLPGAIMTEYSYNPEPFESDAVTVVYGHNMLNVMPVSDLKDELNLEETPIVTGECADIISDYINVSHKVQEIYRQYQMYQEALGEWIHYDLDEDNHLVKKYSGAVIDKVTVNKMTKNILHEGMLLVRKAGAFVQKLGLQNETDFLADSMGDNLGFEFMVLAAIYMDHGHWAVEFENGDSFYNLLEMCTVLRTADEEDSADLLKTFTLLKNEMEEQGMDIRHIDHYNMLRNYIYTVADIYKIFFDAIQKKLEAMVVEIDSLVDKNPDFIATEGKFKGCIFYQTDTDSNRVDVFDPSGNIMADFSIFQNEAIRNYEKTRLGIQGAVEHN